MQAEGTANAAKLPGASGADRDDDEAAEGESAEVRRAPLPKEAAQPSIKEAAQHQAQRLRELQSEHELAARLGSSSGEARPDGWLPISSCCNHTLSDCSGPTCQYSLGSQGGFKSAA